MKEVTEYFERLLWFIYRVLFTLLPSVFLLFIATIFINFSLPYETISALEKTFSSFGFEKWIVIFAVVFCINLIIESFTHLVFKILNFTELSQVQYNKDKALINLLTTYNPKILELLNLNHQKITLGAAVFNFGLAQSSQKSIWFNNYVWFLISREFLFSNLSISILLASISFLPFSIFKYYSISI